jgi:DNA polymerase III sliding clamp (beta) subunit (PCNA family)
MAGKPDLPLPKALSGEQKRNIKTGGVKMIVLTENLVRALEKTKENNVYIMGIKLQKKKILELVKTNANHDTVEIQTGKLSWHDITYHIQTQRAWDTSTGLVSNEIKGSKAAISDIQDKPCIQFYFNHEQPTITARMFEYNGDLKSCATIKFNTTGKVVKQELAGIAIDPESLLSAINVVAPAMATDTCREVLHAMYFELTPDKITLTAADGFRLVTTSFPCETGMTTNFLISLDDIPKLTAMLNSIGKKRSHGYTAYDSDIFLNITGLPDTTIPLTNIKVPNATVTFAIPNKTVTFKTLQGYFPQYQKLIPDDNGTSFEFRALGLLNTIKPLKKVSQESSGIIRMIISQFDTHGVLTVSARAEEVGDVEVKGDTTLPNIIVNHDKIAMNYAYLADALKSFGDKTVTCYLTSSSSPFKLVSENITMVIMPMFAQWNDPKPSPVEPDVISNEEEIDTTEIDNALNQAVSVK